MQFLNLFCSNKKPFGSAIKIIQLQLCKQRVQRWLSSTGVKIFMFITHIYKNQHFIILVRHRFPTFLLSSTKRQYEQHDGLSELLATYFFYHKETYSNMKNNHVSAEPFITSHARQHSAINEGGRSIAQKHSDFLCMLDCSMRIVNP